MAILRTRLVSVPEYWAAHRKSGSIYFIRNRQTDAIKVGHSRDVGRRLQTLQVGNSARLELIGCVAAAIEIEPHIHQQFLDGRLSGEWFMDRGVTSAWLMDMTQGHPLYRHVWEFVDAFPKSETPGA